MQCAVYMSVHKVTDWERYYCASRRGVASFLLPFLFSGDVDEGTGQCSQRRYKDKTETADKGMDEFRRYKDHVDDVFKGNTTTDEVHQHARISSRIGKEECRCHGSYCVTTDGKPAGHQFKPGNRGMFFQNLVHGGGDIHRKVHHSSAGGYEDAGYEYLCQVDTAEPCIE